MPLSVTRVVNALLCSDELYCPLHQSGAAVAGATNAVNTTQSEAVTVSLFFPPPHPTLLTPSPLPTGICTLPSFAHIKRPRWRPVRLNDRHLRSHGKIGDCEQSRNMLSNRSRSCNPAFRTPSENGAGSSSSGGTKRSSSAPGNFWRFKKGKPPKIQSIPKTVWLLDKPSEEVEIGTEENLKIILLLMTWSC